MAVHVVQCISGPRGLLVAGHVVSDWIVRECPLVAFMSWKLGVLMTLYLSPWVGG